MKSEAGEQQSECAAAAECCDSQRTLDGLAFSVRSEVSAFSFPFLLFTISTFHTWHFYQLWNELILDAECSSTGENAPRGSEAEGCFEWTRRIECRMRHFEISSPHRPLWICYFTLFSVHEECVITSITLVVSLLWLITILFNSTWQTIKNIKIYQNAHYSLTGGQNM